MVRQPVEQFEHESKGSRNPEDKNKLGREIEECQGKLSSNSRS